MRRTRTNLPRPFTDAELDFGRALAAHAGITNEELHQAAAIIWLHTYDDGGPICPSDLLDIAKRDHSGLLCRLLDKILPGIPQ